MRFGSLFTGVGGFDIGFERAGMECAFQVEVDKYCNYVLNRHWPDVRRYEDVRTVGKENLEAVELICGGSPCQDVSVAGKRAGLDGERSGLWFEFERIIAELKPKWVVIENVPGLLSSNNGEDFSVVLRALAECGFGVGYRIFDSQNFGVAQRRRRVFIVASLGNMRCGQVLFEQEGVSGDIEKGKGEGERAAAATSRSSYWDGGQVADTLDKSALSKGQMMPDKRRMPAVMVQLTGDRDNPSVSTYDDVSPTIPANPMSDRGASVVWEMSHADDVVRESDKVPTLQKRMGTGGNQVPLVGVRRLTPTECCRLQGFEDDHNEWGLDNGERVEISDSQRYKQMGNAITTNVAEWIGKRIVKFNF